MEAAALDRYASRRLDLTDKPFGKLVALRRLPKTPGTQGDRWLCRCECGRETEARVKDLSNGNTRSCGCLTGRPRANPDAPHRAGPPGLYEAVQEVVWEALTAGRKLRSAGVRAQFDGVTSRSTLYRFINKAADQWAAIHPGPMQPAPEVLADLPDVPAPHQLEVALA